MSGADGVPIHLAIKNISTGKGMATSVTSEEMVLARQPDYGLDPTREVMTPAVAQDLAVVLRRYGFLGVDRDGTPVTERFGVCRLEPGAALPHTPVSLVVARPTDVERCQD